MSWLKKEALWNKKDELTEKGKIINEK